MSPPQHDDPRMVRHAVTLQQHCEELTAIAADIAASGMSDDLSTTFWRLGVLEVRLHDSIIEFLNDVMCSDEGPSIPF